MIVISTERFVPINPGWIVLQDKDGVYYYVRRTLYDQAVILEDRYRGHIPTLCNLIGGNANLECIEKFIKYAPSPLHILGYFLALLDGDIDDFTDIVGALYLITSNINVRMLITQPAEVRQQVRFSLSVREEYSDLWDRFLQYECYPYDVMKEKMDSPIAVPMIPKRTTLYYEDEKESESNFVGFQEDEAEDEALAAEVDSVLADIMATIENAGNEEEEKPSSDSGLAVLKGNRRKL